MDDVGILSLEEAAAAGRFSSLEEAGFGGMFLDAEDNSVVYVYLVNPSQAAAEAAVLLTYGHERMKKIREVRPLKARYTIEQLVEYYKAVGDIVWSFPDVNLTDLDEGQNLIEVGVDCESSIDRVGLALQNQLPSLGVPIEAVVVGVRERPRYRPGGFECILTETIDPITGLSTPGFGGLYFQDDIVSVYLLEPSQEVAEQLVIEELGRKEFRGLQGVRAVQGTYTWAQLMEWYESVRVDIYKDSAAGMVTVDPGKNRLTIWAPQEYVDDAERKIIKAVLSRHGVPCEAVVLLLEDGTTRRPASALCPP